MTIAVDTPTNDFDQSQAFHALLPAGTSGLAREDAGDFDSSAELLQTIGDVLDIRTVFSRVSAIANRMLPHDAMVMSSTDKNGNVVREASTRDVPELSAALRLTVPTGHEIIIDDLSTDARPLIESPHARARLIRAGYRSALSVGAHGRDQAIRVALLAKQPGAFHSWDLPAARRIANHIALAVSHERLAEAAQRLAETQARAECLEARVQVLAEELGSHTSIRIVGDSIQWRDVLKRATRVAATDTTVLLTGESGTGKEIVAPFLHRASRRTKAPFIALNCAALPEQLLESELFGYERGAFTGAQQTKPGQIEIAAGGVLFLDEVSEMSLTAQAKFLRVLQEREFQRLGGTRLQKANVRIIAATNRDLRKAVERGDFREDLYYRLRGFDIRIPPLPERKIDTSYLCRTFLRGVAKSFGRPPAGLTRDAREALLQHDWPGNVRELRNALERAAILCEGGLIGAQHLSLYTPARPTRPVEHVEPAATTDLNVVERET